MPDDFHRVLTADQPQDGGSLRRTRRSVPRPSLMKRSISMTNQSRRQFLKTGALFGAASAAAAVSGRSTVWKSPS